MKNLAKTLIFLIIVLPANTVNAKCFGNACKDVSITRIGGCIFIKNNGSKKVGFSHGAGHAPRVYPGEQVKLLSLQGAFNKTGQCQRNIRDYTVRHVN